eukprot:395202-Hanusia_phi.AAC.4
MFPDSNFLSPEVKHTSSLSDVERRKTKVRRSLGIANRIVFKPVGNLGNKVLIGSMKPAALSEILSGINVLTLDTGIVDMEAAARNQLSLANVDFDLARKIGSFVIRQEKGRDMVVVTVDAIDVGGSVLDDEPVTFTPRIPPPGPSKEELKAMFSHRNLDPFKTDPRLCKDYDKTEMIPIGLTSGFMDGHYKVRCMELVKGMEGRGIEVLQPTAFYETGLLEFLTSEHVVYRNESVMMDCLAQGKISLGEESYVSFYGMVHAQMVMHLRNMYSKKRSDFMSFPEDDDEKLVAMLGCYSILLYLHRRCVFMDPSKNRLFDLTDGRMMKDVIQKLNRKDEFLQEVLLYVYCSLDLDSFIPLEKSYKKSWCVVLVYHIVDQAIFSIRGSLRFLEATCTNKIEERYPRKERLYSDTCHCCGLTKRLHAKRMGMVSHLGLDFDDFPRCLYLEKLLDAGYLESNPMIQVRVNGRSYDYEPRQIAHALDQFFMMDTETYSLENHCGSIFIDFAKVALVIYLSKLHGMCYADVLNDQMKRAIIEKSREYRNFRANGSEVKSLTLTMANMLRIKGAKYWEMFLKLNYPFQQITVQQLVKFFHFGEVEAMEIVTLAMKHILYILTAFSFLDREMITVDPEGGYKDKGEQYDSFHCCVFCQDDKRCSFCLDIAELDEKKALRCERL